MEDEESGNPVDKVVSIEVHQEIGLTPVTYGPVQENSEGGE